MNRSFEVIVVNFNAGEALERCVRSILQQAEKVHVSVIDNASSDGSEKRVRALFAGRDDVSVTDNAGNPGFASAVNSAAAQLRDAGRTADYLLILNPDCELQDGALGRLADALEQDADAALAAPLVVDERGQPRRATLRRFPDPWKSLMTFSGLWRLGERFDVFSGVESVTAMPPGTEPAEAVSGACMLMKYSVFYQVNGLDSNYRLHCEDLDLMYRLRQQGWRCLIVPGARAYHGLGVSSRSRPAWVHWQKHRGMQRFFTKFQAEKYSLPIRWLVVAGIWLRFVVTLPLQYLGGSR
jgi:GT2 family glycosyltransferase